MILTLLSLLFQWFLSNFNWILSLIIQSFIAYHVYWLTMRLTIKSKLEHKDHIKKKVDDLFRMISQREQSSEVYLVNTKRYFKDYPSNTEKRFEGYSHIRAEIKSLRYNGVEFFSGAPVAVYRKENGRLSFSGEESKKLFNAYPVGLVPYEWIEHVDLDGDEYAFVPLFYCKYKGRSNWKFWRRLLFFGYPYKELIYYKESRTYEPKNDPTELKYTQIFEKISKN